MTDPLHVLAGVKSAHVIAGFLGGVVRALVRPGTTLWRSVAVCVVGAITAGYLTPLAVRYAPASETADIEPAVAFLVGLTGMYLADILIGKIKDWASGMKIPPPK